MEFNEFIDKTQKSVCEVLGKDVKIEVKDVEKNNGVMLRGMIISRGEEAISPTIYVNGFYEDYKSGKSFGEIVLEIVEIYEKNKINGRINLNFFWDYNAVKGRIFLKVINYEKNKDALHNIPYVRIFDLAVVCYYAYLNDFLGRGSIQIETKHLNKWGVSKEDIMEQARKNTLEKLRVEVKCMGDVLSELLNDKLLETDPDSWKVRSLCKKKEELPMYIMTLRGRYFGAACICFEEFLADFAKKCNRSFFILPSSIHELILIPDSGREKPEVLKNMVQEVNAGHVPLEDQLSDHVYYYDISKNSTKML